MHWRNCILICAATSLLLNLCCGAPAAEKEKGKVKTEKTESPAEKKLTREYLLAQGFKASPDDKDVFIFDSTTLGEVAAKLGFTIASLRHVPNSPIGQDVRQVFVNGAYCVVRSESVLKTQGFIDLGNLPKLDKPAMRCDVMVALGKLPPPHLRTDGTPQMKIKSVTVPKDPTEPIEATIELSTNGKTPLAMSAWMLSICLYENNEFFYLEDVPVRIGEPPIIVQPGKTAIIRVKGSAKSVDGKPWGDLAPGKHVLRVSAGTTKQREPEYDYEWVGQQYPEEVFSDDYSITIERSGDKKEEGEIKTESPAEKKLTREYLLAQGFKASPDEKDVFTLESATLGDVAAKLGFAIESLRPVLNSPIEQDVRHVFLDDAHCIVKSESVLKTQGFIDLKKRPQLDNPGVRCEVWVSLGKPRQPDPHVRTDGTPQMKIKSVTVPKGPTEPIEATIELSTNGKTPLAIDDRMLYISLYENNERFYLEEVPIRTGEPQITVVQPGKTVILKVNGSTNSRDGRLWSNLAPRKYILRVGVGNTDKSYDPAYDYQWVPERIPGEVLSDDYSITIGPSSEKSEKDEKPAVEPSTKTPELTREYLLAQGFKASADDKDVFILDSTTLGEVAAKLGFAIASLRLVLNSPIEQDVRHVFLDDAHCIVKSESVLKTQGFIDLKKRPQLDNPGVRCEAWVALGKLPPPHLRTDGTPQMKIKSVTVPKDPTEPIEATIELSTNGKTPLAIDDLMLYISLYENNERFYLEDVPIRVGEPQITVVQPGKTAILKVRGSTNSRDGRLWSHLAPRKYILRVGVGNTDKSYDRAYDYQWVPERIPGEVLSDEYSITIGPSGEKK